MTTSLRILALEPFYGGSHRAFLDGWSRNSRHAWTLLHLPAREWKWRMRHAGVTFADEVRARADAAWDVLFCTDMLNLAEFAGLAPPAVGRLPRVLYFHENQLTYPSRHADERDLHFAFSNLVSALAADAVWFNSAFHRDDFLDAVDRLLSRMPDYPRRASVAQVRDKSLVQPPGIDAPPVRPARAPGVLHIVWAARWEHDKNPEDFFGALEDLAACGVRFRLSVIGEQFDEVPPVFARAARQFAPQIVRWGNQPTRESYGAALAEAHVAVSTAWHEFFGISIVEAVAAGCFPLVPKRLAYPEVLGWGIHDDAGDYFYDGSRAHLALRLTELAARAAAGPLLSPASNLQDRIAAYAWPIRAAAMDQALADARDACVRG